MITELWKHFNHGGRKFSLFLSLSLSLPLSLSFCPSHCTPRIKPSICIQCSITLKVRNYFHIFSHLNTSNAEWYRWHVLFFNSFKRNCWQMSVFLYSSFGISLDTENKEENSPKPVKLLGVSGDILALFTPNILKKEDGERAIGATSSLWIHQLKLTNLPLKFKFLMVIFLLWHHLN